MPSADLETVREILAWSAPVDDRLRAAAPVIQGLDAAARETYPRVPWALLLVAAEIVARGDASPHEIRAAEPLLQEIAGLLDPRETDAT
ncbi:MAG TPA: hypothetical protein VFB58_02455 [Chloroflexota bacterium]|nr:hypothetical protein [Chloroflexota bacterium]